MEKHRGPASGTGPVNTFSEQAARTHSFSRYVLIAVLVVLARSAFTFPIQHTDAMQKAYYAAEIVRSGDWSLLLTNHHTLRWAAMLPEIAAIEVLGYRYEVLYLLPLLVFALYVTTILFCLRDALRPPALALLGVILFVEPMGLFVSNEFLVSGLGILFAVAATCCLVHGEKRPLYSACVAGLLFFCAYGSHVTYLSFAAGGVLWLLLTGRDRKRALLMTGVLLLGLVSETILINALSGQELVLGRVETLAFGEHLARNRTSDPVAWGHFFTRWLALPWPDVLLCATYVCAGAGAWLTGRWRQAPATIQCLYLVGLCYAVAVSFPVLDLDPLRTAIPLRPRYLVPFLPFSAIISVAVVQWIAVCADRGRHAGLRRVHALLAGTLIFVVVFSTGFYREKFSFFVWRADVQYSGFSSDFRAGRVQLTGPAKVAHSMLAQFKRPAAVRYAPNGVYAGTESPPRSCAARLLRCPVRLNYRACPAEPGPRAR